MRGLQNNLTIDVIKYQGSKLCVLSECFQSKIYRGPWKKMDETLFLKTYLQLLFQVGLKGIV